MNEQFESQELQQERITTLHSPEGRGKQPFHPPTLTKFGSLVELVQNSIGRGTDGSGIADISAS